MATPLRSTARWVTPALEAKETMAKFDGKILVIGLGALAQVSNAELANDRIVVNGVGGDTVNVNGTAGADTMQVLPSPDRPRRRSSWR